MINRHLSVFLLLTHLLATSYVNHLNSIENQTSISKAVNNEENFFTFSELIKTFQMTWDEFDDFAISKGFTFDKYQSETEGTLKSYLKGKYSLVKGNMNTYQKHVIAYGFSSQEEYVYFKNELKKGGYKFIEQKEVANNNVVFNYLKGNIQAQLNSYKEQRETNYTFTLTEIELTK